MDRLEQYLDQVCRSIGGPRAMRQHVRQELREHLLDAVAGHRAAGLSEEEAVSRALEEFGKPEEVRSELEATHGHRVMAVVIDKALQWKERTMKAKWLWASWAFLSLAAVVALEALFITFLVLYIVPRYQKLMRDGLIDYAILEEQGVTWMAAFLHHLRDVAGGHTTFILLGAAVLWGLFEWGVRSENKPFMRLSALGTVAVVLLGVIVLATGSMVVSFTLAMPAMDRMSRPFALEQVAILEKSIAALEQALAKEDWKAMQEHADQASHALSKLTIGPAIKSLASGNQPPAVEELRGHVNAAREHLAEAQQAIRAKDAGRLKAALQKVRDSFGPVREAAKKPAR